MTHTLDELADLLDEARLLVQESHSTYYRFLADGGPDMRAVAAYQAGGTPTPCACAIGALYHISLVHETVRRLPMDEQYGLYRVSRLRRALTAAHPVLDLIATHPARRDRGQPYRCQVFAIIDDLHCWYGWPIARIASWLRELGVEEEA